jgi:hypothetical protein
VSTRPFSNPSSLWQLSASICTYIRILLLDDRYLWAYALI